MFFDGLRFALSAPRRPPKIIFLHQPSTSFPSSTHPTLAAVENLTMRIRTEGMNSREDLFYAWVEGFPHSGLCSLPSVSSSSLRYLCRVNLATRKPDGPDGLASFWRTARAISVWAGRQSLRCAPKFNTRPC